MKFEKVKDTGVREDMPTGSRRDTQKGKPRPDLNNPLVIRRLGIHMANGCDKYGEHNFELGQKTSRYLASLERHLLDFKEGLDDEDHAAAIMWNIHGIIMNQEFVERGIYPPGIDDRTDYRDADGFNRTVGKWARDLNDKLREAENNISDVTYSDIPGQAVRGELLSSDDCFIEGLASSVDEGCFSCKYEDTETTDVPCRGCGELYYIDGVTCPSFWTKKDDNE